MSVRALHTSVGPIGVAWSGTSSISWKVRVTTLPREVVARASVSLSRQGLDRFLRAGSYNAKQGARCIRASYAHPKNAKCCDEIACRSARRMSTGRVYYLVTRCASALDGHRRKVSDSGGCSDEKTMIATLVALMLARASVPSGVQPPSARLPCPRRRGVRADSADPARHRFQQRFVDGYQVLSSGRTDQENFPVKNLLLALASL